MRGEVITSPLPALMAEAKARGEPASWGKRAAKQMLPPPDSAQSPVWVCTQSGHFPEDPLLFLSLSLLGDSAGPLDCIQPSDCIPLCAERGHKAMTVLKIKLRTYTSQCPLALCVVTAGSCGFLRPPATAHSFFKFFLGCLRQLENLLINPGKKADFHASRICLVFWKRPQVTGRQAW